MQPSCVMMRLYCNSVATIYQQTEMKFLPNSQPNSHGESPSRSLLLQSALLRGAGALVLCGVLAAVLAWASRPMV